jgi:vesicular inhibitory amino acid transporter
MSVNDREQKPLLDATGDASAGEAPLSFIPHYAPPSSGRSPQNTWLQTAFYMTAQMAGVGVLGMPQATQQSGYLGLPLLVVTATICMITANLLGSIMMRMDQSAIRDYPSIGGAAFGRVGVAMATASQYSTLAGVSVVFLLLSGNFLNGIVCAVPARFFTVLVGLSMIGLLIAIPVMKEVRFLAYLGVITTVVASWFAVILALLYYTGGPCTNSSAIAPVCAACQHDVFQLSIASGFSVFSFAFGGHSSIPNFFVGTCLFVSFPFLSSSSELKHPRHFYKTTAVVYPAVLLLLYLPMAAVGYLAYGQGLAQSSFNTVLDAILFFDPSQRVSYYVINAILILHLLCALPIILTPVCLRFQRALIQDKTARMSRSWQMIAVRVTVISILTVVAVVVPYFLPMISIVTDVSVVFSVYVFPAVFYWKLRTSWKRGAVFTVLQRGGLVLIILYGLLGSALGLREAIPGLVGAVQSSGNPFANIFTFGCPGANASHANVSFADSVCILAANITN